MTRLCQDSDLGYSIVRMEVYNDTKVTVDDKIQYVEQYPEIVLNNRIVSASIKHQQWSLKKINCWGGDQEVVLNPVINDRKI